MSDANPCDPDDPVTDQGRANSSPWTEPPVCPIAVPNNTGEIVWIDGNPVFLLGPGIGSAEGGGPDCPPVPPPAVKFVTAAENVGTGTGLYLQTVDGVIELMTLGAGTNISFAIVGNTLVISSSGGLSAVTWNDVTGKPAVFPPSAHAASHTDGTDDIQDATAAQKGLATAAQITKLNGIETGATADQSAAEILAALLTVDGTGSGLDADLLDGNSAAAFATAAQGALADTSVQPTDSATTLNMNTARLLGRTTAAAGAVEEITVGTGLSLSAGALTATIPMVIQVACSDETTALTVADGKVIFRAPYAFTLTAVRASVTTAPTGGTLLTVDITEAGTTVLSTLLTFDAGEKTTTTATTPAVISDSAIADDAEISINVDAVGSTIAGAGLKVTLLGTKP